MRSILFLLFASFVCAREPAHRFEIGSDTYYRYYSEQGESPGFKSDEYGVLYGVAMGYNYVKACRPYVGAELDLSLGKTVYDGALINIMTQETIPYKSHTYNGFLDGEVRGGWTWEQGKWLTSGFIGLGYHAWHRGSAPNDPYGYSEDYRWPYYSIGVRNEIDINQDWTIGINAKVMRMFCAVMEADDIDATFHLGNEWQCALEVPITYRLLYQYPNLNYIRIVPYFLNQDIGRSDEHVAVIAGTPVTVFEPSSTTFVYGLKFQCVWSF